MSSGQARSVPISTIEMARGASYLIVASLLTTAISIPTFAVIARILSPEELGIMTLMLLIVSVTQTVSSLGLPQAIAKYTAERLGEGSEAAAYDVTRKAVAVIAIISLALGVLTILSAEQITLGITGSLSNAGAFRVLGLDVVFAGLYTPLTNSLLGLKKIRALGVLNVLSFAVQRAAILALLLAGWGLLGVAMGLLMQSVVFVGLSLPLTLKARPNSGDSSDTLKRLLSFSWPLYLASYVSLGFSWFDRAILAGMTTLDQVGVYNVAYTAFTVLYAVPGYLAMVLFPHLSEAKGREGLRAVEESVRAASRYIAYIVTPLALGLASTALPAITLFAGDRYAEGAASLAILALCTAVFAAGASTLYVLLILEETKIYSAITLLAVTLSLATAYIIIPVLNIEGAAVARGLAMIASVALTIIALRRRIGLRLDRDAIVKSWLASLVMSGAVLAAQIIMYQKYLLPLYVILGAAVYVIMLRQLGAARAYDIELLKALAGKRGSIIIERIADLLKHS